MVNTYIVLDDVVYYRVNVIAEHQSYTVQKRYNQFVALHEALEKEFSGSKLPALPAKKWKFMVDHTDPEFVTQRQGELNTYIQALVSIEKVDTSKTLANFLSTDKC
jgi:hypothetical protein